MLRINKLTVKYGNLLAVKGATIHVGASEIVAVVGPNGAGKTSLAKGIVGLTSASGEVSVEGDSGYERLNGRPAWAIARAGILYVPETRIAFDTLSVEDNLKIALSAFRVSSQLQQRAFRSIWEKFPLIRDRSRQRAGTLSGGEKRTLAIARAVLLMDILDALNHRSSSHFRLLILDEPTHGLHPASVTCLTQLLTDLNRAGISILLVEQMASFALGTSSRGYLMREGEVILEGASDQLLKNPDLADLYLGIPGENTV